MPRRAGSSEAAWPYDTGLARGPPRENRESPCYDSPVAQRIFVTGSTGFIGKRVVRALLARGFLVRCLVRPGSENDLKGFESIDRVPGDVLRPDGLAPSMEGCAAVVHLVGIIRERRSRGVTFERLHTQATRNMLALARTAGVKRYVQMSALGTRADARSRYHRTKWAAEEAVRASPVPWTIFRPSIIYGRGDGFVTMLGRMIERLPVVPVIGTGRQRLQPVPVAHVAQGFVRALTLDASVKHTYEVGGPEPLTMVDLVDRVAAAMGRRRPLKAHAPLGLVRAVTRVLYRFPDYPLTPDQLLMLEEENTCEPGPFYETFGLAPVALDTGLAAMLG